MTVSKVDRSFIPKITMDFFGSIARRGDRSWLAAKLSSLAPQLHNQDSRGDIAGITPHVVAGAPFDRTGMRG